ncbi:hypothetical protein LT335_00220 [Spiroplasma sp. JKS002669]|uniref:ABC transporter permease n=1 Tax=Spiroplasma attinicola TaxID=2904537 RepID=UPI002022CDBA|nr:MULTISPECIES: ABC transporter permease [unclassified Spiroplasma]MCL6428673.1 hypothetical protein [Spiroplasma sp. JKS002669]MCL8210024.1 hypothetical protein [Spiroplasma sp. JKS002670]
MINFKFLKIQIKNTIWITVIFAIIFALISILSMSFTKYFWDTTFYHNGETSYEGAIDLLHMISFFGPLGEGLAVVFAIALTMKLISTEINRNYISSWLSLPMSRKTIFLTKLFTIFISSFIIVLFNLIIQLLIAVIKPYSDFAGAEVAILIKLNFGLLLSFLFISSMIVLFAVFFNKISHVLTVSALVPAFFIVLFLLGDFANTFDVKFLHYLKYLTFFSLFDNNQLIKNANLQFIWKFILLIFLTGTLFYGSFYLFKRKNLDV